MEAVKVVLGDTKFVKGLGSFGSRSLFVGGTAILEGTKDFLKKSMHFEGQAGAGKIWAATSKALGLPPIERLKCNDFHKKSCVSLGFLYFYYSI